MLPALTGQRDVLERPRVVAMLAPYIDPDAFRAQATAIGNLPQPFVIMTNRDDRALRISSILNGGRQKVGDLSRAEDVAGSNIALLDCTALADGANLDHFVPMTSPAAMPAPRELVKSDGGGEVDLSDFDVGEERVIRTRETTTTLPVD